MSKEHLIITGQTRNGLSIDFTRLLEASKGASCNDLCIDETSLYDRLWDTGVDEDDIIEESHGKITIKCTEFKAYHEIIPVCEDLNDKLIELINEETYPITCYHCSEEIEEGDVVYSLSFTTKSGDTEVYDDLFCDLDYVQDLAKELIADEENGYIDYNYGEFCPWCLSCIS